MKLEDNRMKMPPAIAEIIRGEAQGIHACIATKTDLSLQIQV